MRAERFDDLTRHLADAAGATGTRRSLLRAIGLGGAAVSLGPVLAAAGPGAGPTAGRGRMQGAPADPVEELAFELEFDIDRIFRFVRDEVVYDPYPGVLRGAKGTLWGLAGNAADQAVLLKALLDASLVPTRLVVGELDETAAASLLAAGELDAETVGRRVERLFVPSPEVARPEPEATTPEQDAFLDAFPSFVEEVAARIDGHVAAGIATVREALDAVGVTLPPPSPAAIPEAELRQHIWVQVAQGPDWADLDPSLPDAEPGDVFAANPTPMDAVPEELVHRVSFRLVAEQVAAGTATEVELLAFDAPSADLLDVPLTLIHPQPEALEQIGVGIGGAIAGFRSFVPSLLVGEETVFGQPVTFGDGGGLLDAFGGDAVEGDTLAEWLEVTVTTPDGPTTTRRAVFDRVDPDVRASGAVDPNAVAPVDFVDGGGSEGSFLPLAGLWSLAVATGVTPERAAAWGVPEDLIVDDLLPSLHAYHYARDVEALRQPALSGGRLFVSEPNVTAFVHRPTAVETDGGSAEIGLDLLHRAVAVAPGSTSGDVHPRVAAGVLAHAVEQVMFEAGGLEPLNLPVSAATGVLPLFAAAADLGVAVVVLPPDGAGSDAVEMPAAARLRVDEHLAAGRLVVAPERPVELGGEERTGWWVVDPATGATWDQMDDGGGSTMSEYAYTVLEIASCALIFAGLGAAMGSTVRGISGLITGNNDTILAGGIGTLGGVAAGAFGTVGCA